MLKVVISVHIFHGSDLHNFSSANICNYSFFSVNLINHFSQILLSNRGGVLWVVKEGSRIYHKDGRDQEMGVGEGGG